MKKVLNQYSLYVILLLSSSFVFIDAKTVPVNAEMRRIKSSDAMDKVFEEEWAKRDTAELEKLSQTLTDRTDYRLAPSSSKNWHKPQVKNKKALRSYYVETSVQTPENQKQAWNSWLQKKAELYTPNTPNTDQMQKYAADTYNSVASYATDTKKQYIDQPLEDRRLKQNDAWAKSDSQAMLADRNISWKKQLQNQATFYLSNIATQYETGKDWLGQLQAPSMPSVTPIKQYVTANWNALSNPKPAYSLKVVESDPYLRWIENRKKLA